MTTDRVFVLLMMVLLMMAGCFEATSTTEAQEEQDSTSENDGTSDNVPNDDDSSSNDPIDSSNGQGSDSTNSGTSTSNSQERIWYSSGGVVNSKWTDGDIEYNGYEKCFEYGPLYNSSTGEYIGEECKRFGVAEFESDWNTTNCTNIGGTPSWPDYYSNPYRYAPSCIDIPLVTISTNPGEVLMIYQEEGVSWETTCGGVSFSVYKPSNVEYEIVEGSSMSCTHELTYSMGYNADMSANNPYIWSIVYEIQDSIVV